MTPPTSKGFTLIELLVVVTIIAFLLALLTPAIDRAIYFTELTVCGARLDGIGVSVQSYALGNRRTYPDRDADDNKQAHMLKAPLGGGGAGGTAAYDARPGVRQYLSLNNLQCPMARQIDLANDDSQWIWTNYSLRSGFTFNGYSGMHKIGDKWSFTDTLSNAPAQRSYRFAILVSDQDTVTDKQRSGGSHPDYGDGAMMSQVYFQDPLYFYSLWSTNKDGTLRGHVDLNFAMDDGSVARFMKIEPMFDERFAAIPVWASGQDYNKRYYHLVPKP